MTTITFTPDEMAALKLFVDNYRSMTCGDELIEDMDEEMQDNLSSALDVIEAQP